MVSSDERNRWIIGTLEEYVLSDGVVPVLNELIRCGFSLQTRIVYDRNLGWGDPIMIFFARKGSERSEMEAKVSAEAIVTSQTTLRHKAREEWVIENYDKKLHL